MLKLIKITASIVTTVCVLSNPLSLPALSMSEVAVTKKAPCLKNNNGIGNNHDIFVELPINSQTLEDPHNQIISVRIDPGNSGQMKLFKSELKERGFNTTEIDFVIAQVWDAEIKVKTTNISCDSNSSIERDYTVFAD